MTQRVSRPQVFLYPDGQSSEVIDLSPFVASFEFTKTIDQPVGQWQVALLPYAREDARQTPNRRLPDLYGRVRSNGIISIGMQQKGGITMGLVDTPARNRRRFGARAGKGMTLAGSDMGKVLSHDNIVRASLTVEEQANFIARLTPIVGPDHSLLSNLAGVWGPASRDGSPVFVGEGVFAVIQWLLSVAPAMQVPLLAADGGQGRPGEYITTEGSFTVWNDGRIFSEQPHSYTGTVWGFIRSILDEDFYEMWLDTLPRPNRIIPEVRLVIRPKPFDEPKLDWLPVIEQAGSGWKDLRTLVDFEEHHVVLEDDCWEENLSYTDSDTFSYYLVTSQHEVLGNTRVTENGLLFPAVDTYHLAHHGTRSYNANLFLLSGNVEKKQDADETYDELIANDVVNFRNRLLNWYRCNKWFERGTITVPGKDTYRVGDPVFLPWMQPAFGITPGVRFYITGVTHRWVTGQEYVTQLRVTRGHNDSTIDLAKIEIINDAIARGVDPLHIAEASR